MKMSKFAIAFSVVLFFAFSGLAASLSVLAETATAAPDVSLVQASQEEQLPRLQIDYEYDNELVTSLYHLYGSVLDDFVNVFLTNNSEETATLLVETQIEGYTTTASDTVNVPPHEQVEVKQNPQLLPDVIDKLNAQHPGNFVINVTELLNGEDDILLHESREVTIYSRRDLVWINGCTQQEEFELIAAWVTPNDPAVEELIRRAADYTDSGIVGNGYSGVINDEKGYVWDRLQAIWQAEEDYNLIYISTPLAFGKEDWSQRIRTPYEVIDQSSGNCIETTCLFASAVEALKLEAAIIYIPGHAYAAVRIDEENADYYFVETTLIGRAGFEQAVEMGAQEWEDTSPHLNAQEDGYAWVNILKAREKGILPMPWR